MATKYDPDIVTSNTKPRLVSQLQSPWWSNTLHNTFQNVYPHLPPELRIEPRTKSCAIHGLYIYPKNTPIKSNEHMQHMNVIANTLQISTMVPQTTPPTSLDTPMYCNTKWSYCVVVMLICLNAPLVFVKGSFSLVSKLSIDMMCVVALAGATETISGAIIHPLFVMLLTSGWCFAVFFLRVFVANLLL